jgi:hypothetical protein
MAGTLHGVYAMSAEISPVPGSSGFSVIETGKYAIHCFQTLTGTKFLIVTDARQFHADVVVQRIYQLYADYVMKNPFYQLDMPIRCELFDRNLSAYASTVA